MNINKYLTNRNVALLGTITFHAVLFAIFTHVHLNSNRIEKTAELVINFVDPEDFIPAETVETEDEEISENKVNILDKFNQPFTNQASSRSNENTVEELRSSMKSLDNARNNSEDKKVDLFSDDAEKREIPIKHIEKEENTDGKGEAERKEENAYTGRSTINYYLENRYSNKLPNPIYTCITGGLIYINIEVNQQGRVVKASYNKRKSTTTNECLKETALKYARKSKFNSYFSANDIQKGYITYDFHEN
jgi:hypothetical protein